MNYRDENDTASVIDFTQDVEINLDGNGAKVIDEILYKVIGSHSAPVSTEEIVNEALQLAEFTTEEKVQRHDNKLAQDFRRRIGVLKSKGVHRIMEAMNEQMEFGIQLGESTLVSIDEETVVPIDNAGKSHFRMHLQHHHSKRMAQIDEIQSADKREAEVIRHIERNMDDDKVIKDYDNGEGLAVI